MLSNSLLAVIQSFDTAKSDLVEERQNTRKLTDLSVPRPIKKFAAFYGTQMSIAVYTTARHFSLYWVKS